MIVPDLASSLVSLFKPENKSQFRRIKHLNSIKMDDFFNEWGYASYSVQQYVNFYR